MTQPRALFLADVLEDTGNSVNDAAAAELRRLHAQCEALLEVEPPHHQYPLQSDRMRVDPVTGDVGIGTPQRPTEPVQEPVVTWDASAPLVVTPHPAVYTANKPSLHFNGPGKEVMRITRDGIYVSEGVSVDETAQAVLDCINTHIQRMLEIARADDVAMLHKCLAVMEREAQWHLEETNEQSTVLNADIAALKEYLK